MDMASRGGKRDGAGRHKGAARNPNSCVHLAVSLPEPLYNKLTEAANNLDMSCSRYMDRLITAIVYTDIDIDSINRNINENDKKEFERLAAGCRRTVFIAMQKDTWNILSGLIKNNSETAAIANMLLWQMAKPENERIKLDMIKQCDFDRDSITDRQIFIERLYMTGAYGSKSAVEKFFQVLCQCIQEALFDDEEVVLPGVGKLVVKTRPQKHGRNLKTGESVYVPEGKCVKYTASETIKNYFRARRKAN